MPIIVDEHASHGDIAGEIDRLKALLRDLDRLGNGRLPGKAELAGAPLLDPVSLAFRQQPCLVGGNHGHPILSGAIVTTSELWVLAPRLGWARTLSRFYRLGRFGASAAR